jgi:hypothetical protein
MQKRAGKRRSMHDKRVIESMLRGISGSFGMTTLDRLLHHPTASILQKEDGVRAAVISGVLEKVISPELSFRRYPRNMVWKAKLCLAG